ncbi:MAG TPA: hypothetical protein VNK96_04950 [Fimbriimonadales bacterium]|nr:hypothetical protein [Fimbriimonadales bacterium]
MNPVSEFREIILQYDLNKHPFYVAWREGTLPIEKLQRYAHDYGKFIASIPKAWETLSENRIANEERYHVSLWEEFRNAVDEKVGRRISFSSIPEMEELCMEAERCFKKPAESLGALYAFEYQQPGTSKTKLEGLRKFYHLEENGEKYFEVHENDFAEPKLLEKRIKKLQNRDYLCAKIACSRMSASIWRALDGLMREEPAKIRV